MCESYNYEMNGMRTVKVFEVGREMYKAGEMERVEKIDSVEELTKMKNTKNGQSGYSD